MKHVAATMPRETLLTFLNALRSGVYKQYDGNMRNKYGYNALGVLQDVLEGDVMTESLMGYTVYQTWPTKEWLAKHYITFFGGKGKSKFVTILPWFQTDRGTIPYSDLTHLDFSQIADLFEEQTEVF